MYVSYGQRLVLGFGEEGGRRRGGEVQVKVEKASVLYGVGRNPTDVCVIIISRSAGRWSCKPFFSCFLKLKFFINFFWVS
jgi:hypothetical protein